MAEANVPVYKKGDRFPYLEGALTEGGTAINAESPINAVAVSIRIKVANKAAVTKTAEWTAKKEGKWRYKQTKADTEAAGDLFTEGRYSLEVVIEWEAGVLEHIPNEGTNFFEVKAILE